MEALILELLHKYRSELFIVGMGAIVRLIELSKIKSKYKKVIRGLLDDVDKLRGNKE